MTKAILLRVFIGVGAATLLIAIVGLLLPTTFTVTRSRVVDAAPTHIHALVADLDHWTEWTPWLRNDPTVVITPGDVTRGAGAHESWIGASGHGRLTLTHCQPDQSVAYDMVFEDGGFPTTGIIRYAPDAEGTRITWEVVGNLGWNPFARYFGLAMGAFYGPRFEDGLAQLKVAAERADSTATAS